MGAVERVIDTSNGREVALKRLILDPASVGRHAKVIALFEREYHTLHQLKHPRIIQVFDYGVDEVGPYYTMELLDGRDLRQQLPLPWSEMCRIARDVASSLAILHARRIVHRDVTPANIRCGDNGNAKLIDFGAMTSMGVVKDVVGTPPFIAPESLQAGVLDGRTDLFALGATLYLGITGRHAYPARTISSLRNTWRSRVPPLKELCPDVPDGLDQLVMELLSLSPIARPQSAAVVFERLSAIGGLPRDEALEVAGAYLSTPSLTGRAEVLNLCRTSLFKTLRGRGRSVLIASEPGMGRSRVLDNVVVEAKLLGALVLRADASDGGEFGVVARLAQSLVEARRECLPSDAGLQELVGGAALTERRDRLLRALNQWLLECAAKKPLVLVIDDVHAIDEPSLAGLAALAAELHDQPLLIVAACTDGAPCRSSAALQLLAESSQRLRIEPLTETDTRSLLASVFADTDNLDVLSSVLFRHARGNPALTMEAAQTLVDAGKLRYAAGAWDLPAEAQTLREALPSEAGLVTRLAASGAVAQELAELLALDVHDAISLPDYAALLAIADGARVHRAVDALIAARIVNQYAERHAFARDGYRAEIQARIAEPTRRALHHRLSRWYQDKGRAPAAAHHASLAGDWECTLRLIGNVCWHGEPHKAWETDPTVVETFERLIAACDAMDKPPDSALRMRCLLLELCTIRDEWARAWRHVSAVLAGLTERCGLSDYAALIGVPESERLPAAIAQAEARHAGANGGLSLLEALTELPRVVVTAGVVAVLAVDVALADSVPSLAPLYPLSPAFALVDRLSVAIVECCRGRVDLGLAGCRAVHAELQADPHGMSATAQRGLRRFSISFIQGIEASMGHSGVLERAGEATFRNPKLAARERYAYYVALGDIEQATVIRRTLERLEIEGGAQRAFPTSWETDYGIHSLTHNLQGLKRCEQQAMQVAEELPTWSVRVELTRLAQVMCGASTESALERATALTERTRWGTADFRYAMFLRTDALFGLGRLQECRALMEHCLSRLERPCDWFDAYELFLARAEAGLGLHDAARERAQRYARMYIAAGVRGVLLGRTYEDVARIGLLIGDVEMFRDNATLCAAEYKCGFNPALTARYERLIREATERNLAITPALAQAATYTERNRASELRSLFSNQLSGCLDAGERLQTVLGLAVSHCGAQAGFLFLHGPQGLTLAAVHGTEGVPSGLGEQADLYWKTATQIHDLVTATSVDTCDSQVSEPSLVLDGMRMSPVLLSDQSSKALRGCGVVVLASPVNAELRIDVDVTLALSQLVLEEDGVTALDLG